uniref:Palmdelphin n=1 Tax=Neolamprologus brichardi TaxID=32507 RepID=A0A3Q4HRQ0_NEOBR
MFDLPSQDKRRIQEEIAKKRRQIEEEKLKLQYIKKKALREQWLMDGLSQQSEEEQEAMRLQAQDEQQQSDHLQSNVIRQNHLNKGKPFISTCPKSSSMSFIPATFAMKISVENDKKTGKSHVVSASTIIPETIQKNGIKVYDDGRKSVYALHPGTTKIHSETVGEMTPAEVEELLHQAADRNVPTEVQYHLPVYSVPYIGTNRPSTPRKSTKSLTNSKPSPLRSVNSFKNGSLILNEKNHCSQGLQEQKSPNKTPLSICQDSTLKVRRVGEGAKLHSREQAKCETFLIPQSHFSTKCPRAFANSTTDTSSPNTAALVSVKLRSEGMPGPKEPVYRTLDRSSSSPVHHKFDPDPLLGTSGDSNKDLPSCAENNVSLNLVGTLPGELKLEPISMIFMGYENAEEEEEDIQAELVIIDNSSDNNDNDEDENEINREEYLLYHPQGYRSKVFQPKVHIAKVIELRDITDT